MTKRKRNRKKIILHPVMTFIILILIVIFVSGILSIFNISVNYNSISSSGNDLLLSTESINNLFSLRGIKYIFSNTVTNFANFTVLSHLIIVLIGIGVMEYSGFLKVAVGLLTKHAKKRTITYVIVLISILASIVDNLPFIAFLPLAALIFKYGKRNPQIGIVACYAGLTCGYGLSLLFTSIDSQLASVTMGAAKLLDQSFNFGAFSMILIMLVAVIILSFIITYITENYLVLEVPKYEFEETEVFSDNELTKNQLKGLVLSGLGSAAYLIIFIYNIIPGLPFSGNFLNYSEKIYIDKLFGVNSFFANGFVFIITMLFIISGLLYGIGSKSIKDNREFVESLGHSLNGIGKVLVFVFASATFISIFKQTNIGNVLIAFFARIISSSSFSGLALVLLTFVLTAIGTLLVPNSLLKWNILAYSIVPKFMDVGISAQFAQIVYRFGECVTLGLTPVFAYFIVYIALLNKYSQDEYSFSMRTPIKYMVPYALSTAGVMLAIIILWYIIGLPLGIGASVAI